MKVRVATFNIENLGAKSLAEERGRFSVLVPQIKRLNADIICFQEIHAQADAQDQRSLTILKELLLQSGLGDYHLSHTTLQNGNLALERNIVTASAFQIIETKQYRNNLIDSLQYRRVTGNPPDDNNDPFTITWERPILHSVIKIKSNFNLHVINVHFKSKIPVKIPGQTFQRNRRVAWSSIESWSEGYFLSSIKRVGQAIETRRLIGNIFNEDPNANIIVCGDFNAEPNEVPVSTILGSSFDVNNPELNDFMLFSTENTIPKSSRYTLFHHGKTNLLDHLIMSKNLIQYYRGAEIHNETLKDESIYGGTDDVFPESDHAPFIAEYDIPEPIQVIDS